MVVATSHHRRVVFVWPLCSRVAVVFACDHCVHVWPLCSCVAIVFACGCCVHVWPLCSRVAVVVACGRCCISVVSSLRHCGVMAVTS